MSIKERLSARILRVREYKQNVSICRHMKNAFYETRKNITATVEPLSVGGVLACIKVCYTYSLPSSTDTGDDIHSHIEYCSCFDDDGCTMFGCPYYRRNVKYKKQQILLQKAISEKRASFRRMFERIK